MQIQINLLDFSCQKFKFKYIFLIFHVKSQIQIDFLDFCFKIANSNSQLIPCKNVNWNMISWLFMLNQKFNWFPWVFKIANLNQLTGFFLTKKQNFTLNHNFKLFFLIFSVKIANSNKFTGFFLSKKKIQIYFLNFSC